MNQLKIKADLHIHTRYSRDSISDPEMIIEHCNNNGINCLAVTDHNTISGAVEMERMAPFKIIVGEEVLSDCGEIIGLFLFEEIPKHRSPEETVDRIKGQGGLVCIPHPFDRFRPHSRLHPRALERITGDIDLIEVFNARTYLLQDSMRALNFAQSHGIPGTVGSDAHVVSEIGRSYMELPDFDGADEFKLALEQGEAFTARTGFLVHFSNIRNRLIKFFGRDV